MPVSGPSKDEAYERGEKAYEDVLAYLREKYHVLPEIKGEPMWLERVRPKALDGLKLAIQEVFWQDSAESF